MTGALRVPAPLVEGARVRVVATSWAVTSGRLEPGLEAIRGMGFDPVLPPNVGRRHRYLAGDDEARLAALVDAITDAEADAIWAAAGGFGATRLLDGLDPALLRSRAPWLIGFSDVTALHAAWHRAGVATLHGPNVSTLPTWTKEARGELVDCLVHVRPPRLDGCVRSGTAEGQGRLLGGNLSVLTALVGTGHLPDLAGALVLFEDIDERTYRIDRMLTQLRQSGVLSRAAGFVIGQLTDCATTRGDETEAEAILVDGLSDLGRPVLTGVALGHETTARPAVLGAAYRITSAGRLVPALD